MLNIEVPDLDYSKDEIDELEHMSPKRKLIFGPDPFYQTPAGLILLNRIHPRMGKPDTAFSKVTHGSNQGGWFHIEADWQTPFTNTTEESLGDALKDYQTYTWKGQRFPTYIIGSQDSYDLTRHYYDENGVVRLLGSFCDGGVVRAHFGPDGELGFRADWRPFGQRSRLGGRFEGAKS